MTTKLVPMRERLLVEKDPGAETIGRLIIPDSVRKPQTVGTVIASGPGYFQGYDSDGQAIHLPSEYREGDRVVMGEFCGVEVVLDGRTLWLLVPDEIHCKVVEAFNAAS